MQEKLSKLLVLIVVCTVIIVGGVMLAQTKPPEGPRLAYAHVFGDGTLDTANSRNVVAFGGADGLYCFKLTFVPKVAIATIADDPTAQQQGLGFIKTAVPPTPLFTCNTVPQPDGVVQTAQETTIGGGHSAGGWAFYVFWRE